MIIPPKFSPNSVSNPDCTALKRLHLFKLQWCNRSVYRQFVKYSTHTASPVNTCAYKNADFIKEPCCEKSGIDMPASDNGHSFDSKITCKNLAGSLQINMLLAAGNPGDMLSCQIVQIFLIDMLSS